MTLDIPSVTWQHVPSAAAAAVGSACVCVVWGAGVVGVARFSLMNPNMEIFLLWTRMDVWPQSYDTL